MLEGKQGTQGVGIIKLNANVLNDWPAEGLRRFKIISKGQFTRMLSHFDLSHFSFTTRWPFGNSRATNLYANERVTQGKGVTTFLQWTKKKMDFCDNRKCFRSCQLNEDREFAIKIYTFWILNRQTTSYRNDEVKSTLVGE